MLRVICIFLYSLAFRACIDVVGLIVRKYLLLWWSFCVLEVTFCSLISFPEAESRTQGSRPRTQKNFEAKDKPSRRGQGHSRKCSPKKNSLQNIFSGDLIKKGLQKFFSGEKDLQKIFFRRSLLEETKKRSLQQARRQRGGRGGHCPPDFPFFPPIYFLPLHGISVGEKSCGFWPEKLFKFLILARKSLWISAKTFFFLEITCFWPEKTFKFLILARKSLRISAKTFFFFGDHLIFTENSP